MFGYLVPVRIFERVHQSRTDGLGKDEVTIGNQTYHLDQIEYHARGILLAEETNSVERGLAKTVLALCERVRSA